MKKTFLISLLSLATLSVYAQSANAPAATNQAVCKKFPNMPANATPVWPKGAYTPLEDPSCAPCYQYKSRHGVMIMECPFLQFPAEHSTATTVTGDMPDAVTPRTAAAGSMEMQLQGTYTGNYPAVCKKDPDMPKNAKPVWPKGAYTPVESAECPPCYEYTSKHGVSIMECPFLRFPAEHKD